MILFIIHFNLTVLLLFCDRTFPFQNMKLRDDEKGESWPISRVLSRMIIPLGAQSPVRSCNLPASSAGHANGCLFGLASSGVYPAATGCPVRGALLPHLFTLTCTVARTSAVQLSVALSVSSRCLGVT